MPDIEQLAADAAPETPEQKPIEKDPFFDTAMGRGWKPLEEFDGDPNEWVDAREFVKRAPLYDRLKNQGKKLKEQEKALHDMAGHIDKVAEASYKRAIADLQREKREAVNDADIARVEEIDREIDQIKTDMVPVKPANGVHPVITEWVNKEENKWFNENPDMATFAISYQESLFKRNPQMDMETSLEEVGKAIKKAFPEKFSNPARRSAPPVESGAAPVSTGKRVFSFKDLNDEQRSIAARFERMGIMKKDDYVKSLAENGLIGA